MLAFPQETTSAGFDKSLSSDPTPPFPPPNDSVVTQSETSDSAKKETDATQAAAAPSTSTSRRESNLPSPSKFRSDDDVAVAAAVAVVRKLASRPPSQIGSPPTLTSGRASSIPLPVQHELRKQTTSTAASSSESSDPPAEQPDLIPTFLPLSPAPSITTANKSKRLSILSTTSHHHSRPSSPHVLLQGYSPPPLTWTGRVDVIPETTHTGLLFLPPYRSPPPPRSFSPKPRQWSGGLELPTSPLAVPFARVRSRTNCMACDRHKALREEVVAEARAQVGEEEWAKLVAEERAREALSLSPSPQLRGWRSTPDFVRNPDAREQSKSSLSRHVITRDSASDEHVHHVSNPYKDIQPRVPSHIVPKRPPRPSTSIGSPLGEGRWDRGSYKSSSDGESSEKSSPESRIRKTAHRSIKARSSASSLSANPSPSPKLGLKTGIPMPSRFLKLEDSNSESSPAAIVLRGRGGKKSEESDTQSEVTKHSVGDENVTESEENGPENGPDNASEQQDVTEGEGDESFHIILTHAMETTPDEESVEAKVEIEETVMEEIVEADTSLKEEIVETYEYEVVRVEIRGSGIAQGQVVEMDENGDIHLPGQTPEATNKALGLGVLSMARDDSGVFVNKSESFGTYISPDSATTVKVPGDEESSGGPFPRRPRRLAMEERSEIDRSSIYSDGSTSIVFESEFGDELSALGDYERHRGLNSPLSDTAEATIPNWRRRRPQLTRRRHTVDMRDLTGLATLISEKMDELESYHLRLVDSTLPAPEISAQGRRFSAKEGYISTAREIVALAKGMATSWQPVAKACSDQRLSWHLLSSLSKMELLAGQLRMVASTKASDEADRDYDGQVKTCAKNVVEGAKAALQNLEAATMRLDEEDGEENTALKMLQSLKPVAI
ncbi:hypothetical protein BJ742DRAFT_823789 [Cladochytrium replicatum]|nr:hypothetical protein BJ742DRAFT_823789 [Cladochytrium replicatum]